MKMKMLIALMGVLATFALLVGLWLGAQPGPATAQESADHSIFMPMVARNSTPSTSTIIVSMSKAAYLQVAQFIQPLLFIDYDSFVWLELDAANLATLSNSGVNFQQQPEAILLGLNRFQFDPLEGEPQLPPEQRTTYAPGEEGFHLVQFFGPTREEWLAGLRAAGAIVIQFQASHAYIVRMTPEEAAVVDEEDFARWVGVYHAAYRIPRSLLQPPTPGPDAAQQQIIENVDVTIYNTGQVTQTIAAIQELGGQFIQQFPATPDGSLVSAIFALPSDVVVDVAQLNTVLWMNFISPEPGLLDEMSDQIVVGNHVGGVPFTGYNAWLASKGVNGSGVRIAIVDTGLDYDHPDLNIVAGVSYDGAMPAGDATCGGHGTHVAGIAAGNASTGIADANGFLWGLGVAPSAGLVAQNAICATTWPPIGGWPGLARDSVINSAVTSNNSWYTLGIATGYSAPTRAHDIMVRDADFMTPAIAEPLIMVFAAGNFGSGASSLGEPQEAKNLITVGNSHNRRALNGFDPNPSRLGNIEAVLSNSSFGNSSRGPALDGRLLPNIAAPGTQIASARNDTGGSCTTSPVPGAGASFYSFCTGTSMAAPHVTGGVALITQWWRTFNAGANPSPAMAKALLINGAVNMADEDDTPATPDMPIPNNIEGWGRMNLNNIINPPVPVIYRDQTTTFGASGQTWSLSVGPADPAQPLKVTLVWSDAPGPNSADDTWAWVNDLDLTVTQGATTYRGNVFASGFSTPGGTADRKNNIENVFIQSPTSGVYDITVTAFNIAGDGVPYNGDSTDQDFALVCFNCEEVTPVIVNIKPGSFPNSINPRSRDVIPVAILTTSAGEYGTPIDFDATTIDPLSVRFGPRDAVWTETGGAFEAHGRGHIEDSKELDESTRDGDDDMVLHFSTQETGIGAGDTEACVKGEWIDGSGITHKFFGCDSVRITPGGSGITLFPVD